MSMHEKAIINCDECGKEYEFNYYRSINVSLEPELKDKVISGEIFKSTCPHCGRTTYIPFPFLYHDMEHKLMIYVNRKENIEEGLKEIIESREEMLKQFPNCPLPALESVTLEEYEQMETIITAYDHNLNMIYLNVYFAFALRQLYEQFKDEPNLKGVGRMYLHDDNGELVLVLPIKNSNESYNIKFSMDLYKYIADNYDESQTEE